MDNLRDRIARAIYGDLIRQQDDLWMHGHGDLKAQVDGLVDLVAVADAAIAELRPQLAAWARMCVDGGDMTPMAQRMLHNILGQPNE